MKKSFGTYKASWVRCFAVLLCLSMVGLSRTVWARAAASVPAPEIKFEKYTLPERPRRDPREDHRLPLVAVNLWYHVGPANERAGRTGFAHLFEHMMFQGSKHVGAKDALQVPRGRRRQRHQRHDRLRPHQLLRDAAVEPARAGAVARVRPHGLPARNARPRRSWPTSRTSCATSGGRASRTRPTASSTKSCFTSSFPRTIRTTPT